MTVGRDRHPPPLYHAGKNRANAHILARMVKKPPAKKRAPRARAKPVEVDAPQLFHTPVVLRPHQNEAAAAFNAGRENQYHIWHRRAGKDWYGMDVAAKASERKVGTYWHLLPKHIQARRAIWTGIDHVTGERFVERFFPDAVGVNNTEMFIELESGSSWQLLGSDNYDRMVGSNPIGVVFSEWALCDPRAYDYIRPILRANGGWAIFITTFRGRNHAWQMYNKVKDNPDWYVTLKTIDHTNIITAADVQADRDTGMAERLIQQEYYCKPVPPPSLGPFARVFEGLLDAEEVREFPASAMEGPRLIAFGEAGDYLAMLECFVRGSHFYIHAGQIKRDTSPHEMLAPHAADVIRGGTLIGMPTDVVLVNTAASQVLSANTEATCHFLERATVSPSSVLAAALSSSLDTMLDEDSTDIEAATFAVYDALQRLAAMGADAATEWHAAPSYHKFDRAVIGAQVQQL